MPSKEHRDDLQKLFTHDRHGVVVLRGASIMHRYGTDYEFPFRQESNFWYLTGVDEPDYGMVLNLENGDFHLIAPDRDTDFAVWNGRIVPREEIRDRYQPDHLHIGKEMEELLREIGPDVIYTLSSDLADELEEDLPDYPIDTESLPDALAWCRAIKNEEELGRLRHAAKINNQAHLEVLQNLRPGIYEYECKALFEYYQMRNGLVQDAYNGIHASGPNSAILHYTGNNRKMVNGDLYLIDAGHEYLGYASDFSRTWPVSGRYNDWQKVIYEIVLEAQKAAIREATTGTRMEELHLLSAKIIVDGLLDAGLLRGNRKELMEKNLFALFFPHGLGHFLGLDTHDVGGYPKGVTRIDRPGLQHLRVRRELAPGMVITVEPGIYFIPALLLPALDNPEKAPYLNRERIERLLDFGGVRIEDNLIITEQIPENLTRLPKEITDIEEVMSRS